eukprot:TRINITY_DN16438_c0_g1_i1.p1 TRINITY_DN16438_c0_g1~~TRINITY_DN16438_c0_g1_i1.p1  ORF type:complete len:309 (-),score=53.85 TRINITY_DN16438_c0_g1_i1:53-979(-)
MATEKFLELIERNPIRQFTEEELERIGQDIEKNGYAVIESLLPDAQINAIRDHAFELVDQWEAPTDPNEVSVFQTRNQEKKDQYFLTSGDKIRFFFEESAFDNEGNLKQSKRISINKIGHGLHLHDPVFRKFSHQQLIAQLSKVSMKLQQPAIVQSMVIFKQPRIGGFVNVHQDSAFIHTEPLSCYGFWFALEDTNLENGCLWVQPGSHKDESGNWILQRRFVNRPENDSLVFDPPVPPPEFDKEKYIPVQCPRGSLVLIHGSVFHMSFENKSEHSRNVYTFHVLDQKCSYSKDNWLQINEPFDTLKV